MAAAWRTGSRRFLSHVARKHIQRKTIGSMLDSEQQLLFGQYSRQGLEIPSRVFGKEEMERNLESTVQKLENLGTTEADSIAFCALVLRQCAYAKALRYGKRVHEHIARTGHLGNVFLGNLLVQMYGKCGDLPQARAVFDGIPQKNKFSWSLMIAAYAQNGHNKEALELYQGMPPNEVELDDILIATVIGVCAGLGNLQAGREIHARITSSNVVVHTALLNMYAKCNSLEDARMVFDRMQHKDVISWNAMLAAYTQNGDFAQEALELFQEMNRQGVKPDAFTYSTVLAACWSLGALGEGKAIHMRILKSGLEADIALENALLNMYAKCGSLDDAKKLFEQMRRKNVISWTCMVGGYAQHGHSREALELYKRMDSAGVRPNSITHANALSACASLGALAEGKEIHQRVIHDQCQFATVVGSALINMYAKCSSLGDARSVFNGLQQKDLVCGNTMIAAYAQFGHLQEALEVYREMVLDGTEPSAITLISLLIGCSHAGRVDDGRVYFIDMLADHSVMSIREHYMCMLDMLGRAGRLQAAEELINTMPFEPDAMGWITLLSACRIHGDVERAERAAEHVFKLEPGEGSHNVLMSNIYLEAGRKKDAENCEVGYNLIEQQATESTYGSSQVGLQ